MLDTFNVQKLALGYGTNITVDTEAGTWSAVPDIREFETNFPVVVPGRYGPYALHRDGRATVLQDSGPAPRRSSVVKYRRRSSR
jgi:hypothetical protein